MNQLPTLSGFRDEVDKIDRIRDQRFIQFLYITAASQSEVVARASRSERLSDGLKPVDVVRKELDRRKYEILEIKLTAVRRSRSPRERYVAVPMEPEIEPWSKGMYEWSQRQERYLFDFGRRNGHRIVKKHLPWIYKLKPARGRKKRLNPWKVLRTYHLRREFDFSPVQSRTYLGKTLSDMEDEVLDPLDRRRQYDWQVYIDQFYLYKKQSRHRE